MGDTLWVGASEFLASALPDSFQSYVNPKFKFLPFPKWSIDRFGIVGMQLRSNGQIWLQRGDGVFEFDPQKNEAPVLRFSPPEGELVSGFYEGFDGRQFLASESGVRERVQESWRWIENSPKNVTKMLLTRDGAIWMFAPDGLHKFVKGKATRLDQTGLIALEPVRGLLEGRDGEIWAGSSTKILRFRGPRLDEFDLTGRVRADDIIQVISQSRDGSIWAASKWGTLIRISEPGFRILDQQKGLPDSAISSVVEDAKHRLWIGSRTKGTILIEGPNGIQRIAGSGGRIHYALAPLPDGRILSLDTDGLSVLDESRSRMILPVKARPQGHYQAFSKAYKDHIYVGDSTRLLRVSLPIGEKPQFENMGELSMPRGILELSDGVWAISWDRGLAQFSNGQSQTFPLDALGELRGYAIFEASSRLLLVATSTGLLGFDRKARRFLPQPPLFDQEQVFVIQRDLNENVWFGCRRALLAARLTNILDYFEGKPVSIIPLRFTPQQGLISANFGLGTSSVSLTRPNGEMWFASVAGAVHFHPDVITRPKEPLRCAIASVLADGIERPLDNSIRLPAGTRNVQLIFTVLGGRAGESPVFRYRMTHVQEKWLESSTNSATFSTLEPGNYRFEVQGRAGSLEWTGPVAPLNVSIDYFWYQRPDVQIGVGLAFLSFAVFAIRRKAADAMWSRVELESRVVFRTAELALARDEAERLRHKAETAATAKSYFLATMSHEIRTPMNGIIGMVDLLKRSPLSAEQKEMLDVVSTSGESLLAIVNDVLSLSRIEAGHFDLYAAPFSLQAMAAHLEELFRVQANGKGIRLEVVINKNPDPWRMGDAARINQVLMNLLSNAIKFTGEGEVSLSIWEAGPGVVLFRVKDTGIGIPAGKLDSIFDPFTQAESSTTRRYGGTGLGLAICRRLASALQGSLTVRSTEAVGSEFNFTIPLPVVEAPSNAEEMGSTDILPQSNLNVLVVEDNPVNYRVAQAMLTRVGCKVTSANDGFEAVAATVGESFDLILMDCQMPNLDGFDATRRIRHEGNPNWRTPIVALSADVLEQDVEKCRDAGMDGFLSKPLRTEQLGKLLVRLAETEKGQPLGWPSSQSNLS